MKLIIDIDDNDYETLMSDKAHCPRDLTKLEWKIVEGTPLNNLFNKIKEEIDISNRVTIDRIEKIINKCEEEA